MTDAVIEEQERVVLSARNAMTSFDGKSALFRWLENYAPTHDKNFWASQWHVVTREGQHWKVESGSIDNDKPFATMIVDGRAPTPPLMEHRPPKPEPVKARERSIEPQRVPSAMEYIEHMLSYSEQQELRQRIREHQQRRRPMTRMSVPYVRWDEQPQMEAITGRYEDLPLSDRDLMAFAHAILDRRFRNRPPPTPMPVRPPPPPTRRNQ